MDINYKTIYFFGISLATIILVLVLTNKITNLNFRATVFATIAIIFFGLIAWIIDIYLNYKDDEEKASQYWDIWDYTPFKKIKDKKIANLIVFVLILIIIIVSAYISTIF